MRDGSDGAALLAVVHYYCPEQVKLDGEWARAHPTAWEPPSTQPERAAPESFVRLGEEHQPGVRRRRLPWVRERGAGGCLGLGAVGLCRSCCADSEHLEPSVGAPGEQCASAPLLVSDAGALSLTVGGRGEGA